MKKSTTLLALASSFACSSVRTAPPSVEPPPVPPPVAAPSPIKLNDPAGVNNKPVNVPQQRTPLPGDTKEYLGRLDYLVGIVCFSVPDDPAGDCKPVSTKHMICNQSVSLGTARSEACPLVTAKLDHEVFNSKVEGDFGAKLNFVLGAVDFKSGYLYELNVREAANAQVPPKYACIDAVALRMTPVPKRFCGAFFASSVTQQTLGYREYHSWDGKGQGGFAGVSAGANVYVSDQTLQVVDTITTYPLVLTEILGECDDVAAYCKPKPDIRLPATPSPVQPVPAPPAGAAPQALLPLSDTLIVRAVDVLDPLAAAEEPRADVANVDAEADRKPSKAELDLFRATVQMQGDRKGLLKELLSPEERASDRKHRAVKGKQGRK